MALSRFFFTELRQWWPRMMRMDIEDLKGFFVIFVLFFLLLLLDTRTFSTFPEKSCVCASLYTDDHMPQSHDQAETHSLATAPAIKMERDGVQILSRRMVKPEHHASSRPPEPETVHLTPWDLLRITVEYLQKGVVVPKPPAGSAHAVEHLASCDDQGAEFVHAVAPGVAVADISGPLRVIPRVVWSFFPLNGMLGADAAVDPSLPLLAVQVTELADGVFVAMSLNHCAADGETLWDLFNTWSEISRSGGAAAGEDIPTVPKRWFLDGCSVPIPLPFAKAEEMVGESVKRLRAKANAETMACVGTTTISSLQAVAAHIWRAVCRARGLAPGQETTCSLSVGCRTLVKGMPQGYVGNASAGAVGRADADEILGEGRLGRAAWLLNRAVAAVDEASVRTELAAWPANHSFNGSPELDVYGNDFGWGLPVAVRSGAGNKVDGLVSVYEGSDDGGMELEVCLAPGALAKLVADQELMDASVQ
uniref:Putative acetyltransferase n=1 Tax=Aegilops tauschii TaxID=37682 RepID=R7WF36_AEGTA